MILSIKIRAKMDTPYTQNGYVITYDTHEVVTSKEYNYLHKEVEDWIAKGNTPLPAFTTQEIIDYQNKKAFVDGTELISKTIQNEIDAYNLVNRIAIANVHNAESYSRNVSYSHQPFCEQVWAWNVELWEFMRMWESTLTELPSTTEIETKIAEKPFIYVEPIV